MIKFLNRSKGVIEIEKVYGDKWLNFTYQKIVGRFLLWVLIKRKLFSWWYGNSANSVKSKKKILPFIKKYNIDETEFLEPVTSFSNFNQFFYRRLKPNARPISTSKQSVVFPADGRHLGFQNISHVDAIYVKGQKFNIVDLFNSKEIAEPFLEGSLVISRLCPVDYHRFHFPCDGIISSPNLINGSLKSVNPIALKKEIKIFWENKRYLALLKNQSLGSIAQFAVGATCVGSVTFTSKPETAVKKGEEFGYFSFGGSCIITLFEKDKIKLSDDLIECSAKGLELYAKMGDEMGTFQNFN